MTYFVEFNCLASHIQWGDHALLWQAYKGLAHHIKNKMVHYDWPITLLDLHKLVQAINYHYWEWKAEITCEANPTSKVDPKGDPKTARDPEATSKGKAPENPKPIGFSTGMVSPAVLSPRCRWLRVQCDNCRPVAYTTPMAMVSQFLQCLSQCEVVVYRCQGAGAPRIEEAAELAAFSSTSSSSPGIPSHVSRKPTSHKGWAGALHAKKCSQAIHWGVAWGCGMSDGRAHCEGQEKQRRQHAQHCAMSSPSGRRRQAWCM